MPVDLLSPAVLLVVTTAIGILSSGYGLWRMAALSRKVEQTATAMADLGPRMTHWKSGFDRKDGEMRERFEKALVILARKDDEKQAAIAAAQEWLSKVSAEATELFKRDASRSDVMTQIVNELAKTDERVTLSDQARASSDAGVAKGLGMIIDQITGLTTRLDALAAGHRAARERATAIELLQSANSEMTANAMNALRAGNGELLLRLRAAEQGLERADRDHSALVRSNTRTAEEQAKAITSARSLADLAARMAAEDHAVVLAIEAQAEAVARTAEITEAHVAYLKVLGAQVDDVEKIVNDRPTMDDLTALLGTALGPMKDLSERVDLVGERVTGIANGYVRDNTSFSDRLADAETSIGHLQGKSHLAEMSEAVNSIQAEQFKQRASLIDALAWAQAIASYGQEISDLSNAVTQFDARQRDLINLSHERYAKSDVNFGEFAKAIAAHAARLDGFNTRLVGDLDELSRLSASVSSLANDLDATKTDLEALGQTVDDMDGDLESVEQHIDVVPAPIFDLSAVDARINAISDSIADLNLTANSDRKTYGENTSTLMARMASMGEALLILQKGISEEATALQARVAEIEKTPRQAPMGAFESSIREFANRLELAERVVEVLRTTPPDYPERIKADDVLHESINKVSAQLGAAVDKLDFRVAELSKRTPVTVAQPQDQTELLSGIRRAQSSVSDYADFINSNLQRAGIITTEPPKIATLQ
jgi:hypothetical protein